MLENFLADLAGEFRIFVIIAICTALGASGYFIRIGLNRKQSHKVWIPVTLWLLFYATIFFTYPRSFPAVLLLLIFPVLGFFGVVIFPDED